MNNKKFLTPTVIKLGLISFLSDIASEMLYPITPIFLTSVLGASMSAMGFIEGLAEGVASLLKTYSGLWSDRIRKRKPFIVVGYLLATLAKPITGFAHSWTTVLFARALDRTGKGLRTAPRDALLADCTQDSMRGAVFGFHRFADTLGAALGPLLALLFLANGSGDLRGIYVWSLLPGTLAVLVALRLKDSKHLKAIPNEKNFKFSLKSFNGTFKKYLAGWTLFALTNSSDVFLLMRARQVGLELSSIILMYCFYNLFYSLLSPYFGSLSDRIGRKNVLMSGLGVFVFTYFSFGWATESWQFWVLFAMYGVFMAMTEGNGKAFAVDLVDAKSRATGLGVLGTFTGFATILASTVAGILWDNLGSQWTFVYGAIGAVAAMCVFSQLKLETKT